MNQSAAVEAWAAAPAPVRARARWLLQTLDRPEQRTPEGDWPVWLFMAGRGAGKTRSAAEDMVHFARTHPGSRLAVVAATYSDAVETCMEGESGILALLDPSEYGEGENWNRSKGELVMDNGTRFKTFSDEKPRKLRGPQHHRVWCDELGAFEHEETWSLMRLGLRLDSAEGHGWRSVPQIVVTTTPNRRYLPLRELLKTPDTVITRATTYANRANLAAGFIPLMEREYGGTRFGRQELYGEMLDDVVGAMWTWALVDSLRVPDIPIPDLYVKRTVVGVDPSGTKGGDETGIITALSLQLDGDQAALMGVTTDITHPHAVVLRDDSGHYTPEEWGRAAVTAYRETRADRIVAEKNYGGEMVASVIRNVDPNVPVTLVTASKGKQPRAEPVAALYEQGRIHHRGAFAALEDEMTTWVPGESSPNRMDALVWALTDLMVDVPGKIQFGPEEFEPEPESDLLTRLM